MKRQKLNYRFHDPNPADVTADYILEVFMDVNRAKVEREIRAAAKQPSHDKEGGCSA